MRGERRSGDALGAEGGEGRRGREGGEETDFDGRRGETFHTAENANNGNYRERVSSQSHCDRGAIVRHYPPQIMEVSLSSVPVQCSAFLFQGGETKERNGAGPLFERHSCAVRLHIVRDAEFFDTGVGSGFRGSIFHRARMWEQLLCPRPT